MRAARRRLPSSSFWLAVTARPRTALDGGLALALSRAGQPARDSAGLLALTARVKAGLLALTARVKAGLMALLPSSQQACGRSLLAVFFWATLTVDGVVARLLATVAGERRDRAVGVARVTIADNQVTKVSQ